MAPAGTRTSAALPACAIVMPSTTSVAFSIGALSLPTMSRAFEHRDAVRGACPRAGRGEMPTRNVVLTEYQENFIETLVGSGRYRNARCSAMTNLRAYAARGRRVGAKRVPTAPHAGHYSYSVFQSDSAPRTQAFARLFNSTQKARIVFKTIFEPVFFQFESDQHPGRLAVARNDDLLRLSLAKVTRQIVLNFGQWNSFIPDLRIVRAIARPPIWPRSPKSRRSRLIHRRILESPTRSLYCGALQSPSLRRPAILRSLMGGRLPELAGWSGYHSIATLSINPGIDVMCQRQASPAIIFLTYPRLADNLSPAASRGPAIP